MKVSWRMLRAKSLPLSPDVLQLCTPCGVCPTICIVHELGQPLACHWPTQQGQGVSGFAPLVLLVFLNNMHQPDFMNLAHSSSKLLGQYLFITFSLSDLIPISNF